MLQSRVRIAGIMAAKVRSHSCILPQFTWFLRLQSFKYGARLMALGQIVRRCEVKRRGDATPTNGARCKSLMSRFGGKQQCIKFVGPEQSDVTRCPRLWDIGPTNQLGIGFVPFAPPGQGFLTGAVDMETSLAPRDFWANTSRTEPENRIALAGLLAQGNNIVPIPATTQMPHLRDNLAAEQISFTDAEAPDA